MTRRAAASVRVISPEGAHVVLSPGDEVPDWAAEQITNPDAVDDDAPAPEASDTEPADGPVSPANYESLTVVELRARIKARNEGRDDASRVPGDGNKADLIAALEADDESV